jgi:hypothetical protein
MNRRDAENAKKRGKEEICVNPQNLRMIFFSAGSIGEIAAGSKTAAICS